MPEHTPTDASLATAFDILDRALTLPMTPETAPSIVARAELAHAIAATEQARASMLTALVQFASSPASRTTPDERRTLESTMRVLAGMPAEAPDSARWNS